MPIAPHNGNELKLMLEGSKHLAAFCDIYEKGKEISEDIIPETSFHPYIIDNKIIRFERVIFSTKNNNHIYYVCFTSAKNEWRAETYLWIREQIHSEKIPYDNSCDIIIGRLLGYNETDINDFINK